MYDPLCAEVENALRSHCGRYTRVRRRRSRPDLQQLNYSGPSAMLGIMIKPPLLDRQKLIREIRVHRES
jgi:hypothetical protein